MRFDPFASDQRGVTGHNQKKRAYLLGNKDHFVHLLAKLALYRGQSINYYHLVKKERRKFEGRNTPEFDAIANEVMSKGVEIPYPNDIPERDVERWVEYGKAQAQRLGLQIGE